MITFREGGEGSTDPFSCLPLCSLFVAPPLNTSDCKGVHELTLTTSHEASSHPHFTAGILSHQESDLSKDRQWRLTAEPGTTANVLEVHCFTHGLSPESRYISRLLETAHGAFPLYLS